MSELKNCPFCGGEAVVVKPIYTAPDVDAWGIIQCPICGAEMTSPSGQEEVLVLWNRRAQPENEALVHCAECEHYTPSPMGGNGCLIRFNGRTEIIPRNPTDFCSHGVRKPERSEG